MNAQTGSAADGLRFAAFVITYRRPATVESTVEALLAQSRPPERILVLDNAGSPEVADRLRRFGAEAVSWVGLDGNLGPAGAAARGLSSLAGAGFDWIYWGDDDDPPGTPDTLERLLELARGAGPDVGAVGAVGSRWDWRRGVVRRLADEELAGTVEVDVIAGSSQLVVSRRAVEEVGLPDARLFFGFEEPEYCLRLRRAGRRLLVDGELMHGYRRRAGRLRLVRRKAWVPRHSPATLWRRYYSTRNYIFAMHASFHRPDLARRESAKAIARSVSAWARGPRYGAAFARLQLRAVADGWRGRLGCTVEPTAPPAAGGEPEEP